LYRNSDIAKARNALQRALALNTPFAGLDEAKRTLADIDGGGR